MRHPALSLSLFLLVACGDKEADSATDSGDSEVDASYAGVQQILTQSCGFSSCHGSGTGGLTLGDGSEHAALVGVESVAAPGAILVVAGDAEQSYLIQKLEGAAGIVGDPMPPSGLLDQARIDAVRAWIDAGAPAE